MKNLVSILFFLIVSLSVCNAQDPTIAVYLQKAYELEGQVDPYLFEKAEKIYLESLIDDSLNYKTMYNLSTLYYNRSLHLRKMAKQDELSDEKRSLLIREANEYMKMYEPYYLKLNVLKEQRD